MATPQLSIIRTGATPVVTLDTWRKVEAAATLQEILRDLGREWLIVTVLRLVGSQELGR